MYILFFLFMRNFTVPSKTPNGWIYLCFGSIEESELKFLILSLLDLYDLKNEFLRVSKIISIKNTNLYFISSDSLLTLLIVKQALELLIYRKSIVVGTLFIGIY